MSITGSADVRGLRDSFRQLQALILLKSVNREVRELLKQQFATGTGPYGPWQPTKRGRQALLSKKLPQCFEATIGPTGLRYSAKSKRDMLTAHQEGHEFAARRVSANRQYLTFDRRGRLIKSTRGRVFNRRGEVKRGIYQVFARAHTVSARELPQRQIVPVGDELPPRWAAAVERGVEKGITRWYDGAVK